MSFIRIIYRSDVRAFFRSAYILAALRTVGDSMSKKGTFYDGFESSIASYLGSVILLAVIPSVLSSDFTAGLILIVIAVGLALISFKDSILDIKEKGIGWTAGFAVGLLIFDPKMLVVIAVTLILIGGCKYYSKNCT